MEFLKGHLTVELNDKKARSALKKIESSFKKSINRMKKIASGLTKALTAPFKLMGKAIKSLLIPIAALTAAIALTVRAAITQEDAIFKMEVALKNAGDASKETSLDFQEFAATLQELTIHGDESILALIQMESSLGVATEELKFATIATIGLSSALNIGAESMARYVALALQGEFTMLNRYIPALRTATTQQEKFNIFLENSKKGFEIARAEAETTSGKLKQLGNTLGDIFLEITGSAFLNAIQNSATAIKKWAEDNRDNVQKFADKIEEVIELITSLTGLLFQDPKEFLKISGDIFSESAKRLGRDLKIILTPIFGELGRIIADAIIAILPPGLKPKTSSQLGEELKTLQQEKLAGRDVDRNMLTKVKFKFSSLERIALIDKQFDEAMDFLIREKQKELSERGASAIDTFEQINNKLKESASIFNSAIIPSVEKLDKITEDRKAKQEDLNIAAKKEADIKEALIQKELEAGALILSQKVQEAELAEKAKKAEEDRIRLSEKTALEKFQLQKTLTDDLKDEIQLQQQIINEIVARAKELGVSRKIIDSWKELKEAMLDVKRSAALSAIVENINNIESAISNMFEAWIDGSKSFSEGFKDLMSNMTKIFFRMIAEMTARWIVFQALTGAFGPSTAAAAGSTNPLPSATPSSPPAMALGGITRGLSIAGEDGPEAVVPLPDGRNIPVDIKGGQSTVVNVINQSSQEVTASQGESFFDGKNFITEVILMDIERGGPIRSNILSLRR